MVVLSESFDAPRSMEFAIASWVFVAGDSISERCVERHPTRWVLVKAWCCLEPEVLEEGSRGRPRLLPRVTVLDKMNWLRILDKFCRASRLLRSWPDQMNRSTKVLRCGASGGWWISVVEGRRTRSSSSIWSNNKVSPMELRRDSVPQASQPTREHHWHRKDYFAKDSLSRRPYIKSSC